MQEPSHLRKNRDQGMRTFLLFLLVLMVIGYYLLILAMIGILVTAAIALPLSTHNPRAIIYGEAACIAILSSLVLGFWVSRFVEPRRIQIRRRHAPPLFAVLDEVGQKLKFPIPDEVCLTHDLNASVHRAGAFLGVIGGRRILTIGLPLLDALTIERFKAVLAHEFAHLIHKDSALQEIVVYAEVRMGQQLQSLAEHRYAIVNPCYWILRIYYMIIDFVSSYLSRVREFAADAFAARAYGSNVCAATLMDVERYGFIFSMQLSNLARTGQTANPGNPLVGFREVIAQFDEPTLKEIEATALQQRAGLFASHPALSHRLGALRAYPTKAEPEPILARSLIEKADEYEASLSNLLMEEVYERRQ